MKIRTAFFLTFFVFIFSQNLIEAQSVMETGGQKMPYEWIDKDTHHKVIRLTRRDGNSRSFYFNNDPFILGENGAGDRMVFYGNSGEAGRLVAQELFTVNLKSFQIEQLTHDSRFKMGEIVGHTSHNVYFQSKDSVFVVNADTKKTSLEYVFPKNFKGSIITLNADETLLAGVVATEKEKKILEKNPAKKDFFNKIYESKQERMIFTINLKDKKIKKVFKEKAWLNHLEFSPTDSRLLMYCHEGPWEKVDRIWTVNLDTKKRTLMHKRTMDREIAGHEWFAPDGKTIWYDLQQPRGETFFVSGTDVNTGKETKYQLERDQWSVHYNISPDQKIFAGDGGSPTSVAKSANGKWINLFIPDGNKFRFEKLVNMKNHDYNLEPNVHFSPDGKWLIFRANFEGFTSVYAVEK